MLGLGPLPSVLLLSLLPALGALLGLSLAEWRRPPPWLTGSALHMAAGIATGVAAIELIPRALARAPEPWLLAAGVLAGSGVSLLLAKIAKRLRDDDAKGGSTLWGAYAAIAIDLFSDGLMTGGGATVAQSLGVLLAASQVVGNLPGGFAITANLRRAGVVPRTRMLAALTYPAAPLLGALGGYLVLDEAGDFLTAIVLALFAGLLLTATIEDLVPEADEPGASRSLSSPAFAIGFVLLFLMSAYLGG